MRFYFQIKKKNYLPANSKSIYIDKIPWTIKGGDVDICVISFDWFMISREVVKFLPEKYRDIDKIEIKFDYSVYKKRKKLCLIYFLKQQ